jgi:hypothetical protein
VRHFPGRGDALAAAAGGGNRIALREPNVADGGGVRRFGIRVSRDGLILPSLDAIRREIETTCVPDGAVEGAPVLLLGAVQWSGDTFRINVRVVDTETGVVKNSVTRGGRGGAAELQQALEGAFANLLDATRPPTTSGPKVDDENADASGVTRPRRAPRWATRPRRHRGEHIPASRRD